MVRDWIVGKLELMAAIDEAGIRERDGPSPASKTHSSRVFEVARDLVRRSARTRGSVAGSAAGMLASHPTGSCRRTASARAPGALNAVVLIAVRLLCQRAVEKVGIITSLLRSAAGWRATGQQNTNISVLPLNCDVGWLLLLVAWSEHTRATGSTTRDIGRRRVWLLLPLWTSVARFSRHSGWLRPDR